MPASGVQAEADARPAAPATTATPAPTGWVGHLHLRAECVDGRTVVRDRHRGPLRVLQTLRPEGPRVCHQVLVHPPGGIVGGDQLEVEIDLDPDAHVLLTTPGATRCYRSNGRAAEQRVSLRLQAEARCEWLPLETLVYSGADMHNALRMDLAPGSRLIGWETLALGLPASGQPFERGQHRQSLWVPGVWRDEGLLRADDHRLLHSPVGFGGRSVLATAFAVAGEARGGIEIEGLLESARRCIDESSLHRAAGATALPLGRGVVVRALADRVEPAQRLLQAVWAAWRPGWMGREAVPPRVWRT